MLTHYVIMSVGCAGAVGACAPNNFIEALLIFPSLFIFGF